MKVTINAETAKTSSGYYALQIELYLSESNAKAAALEILGSLTEKEVSTFFVENFPDAIRVAIDSKAIEGTP